MRDFGTHDSVLIAELYSSLQGEGCRAGAPCVIVRLAGCGLRCAWCDTPYALEGGERRPVAEVVASVAEAGIDLVLLTGGEPLEQPGCLTLASALCDLGRTVLVETGGHVDTSALDPRAVRVLDVKCPGSGMSGHNLLGNLGQLRAEDEVKFVLRDREDFDFARALALRHDLAAVGCALLFSPVHGALDPATLAGWLVAAPLPQARLSLQIHKYIWPETERGV